MEETSGVGSWWSLGGRREATDHVGFERSFSTSRWPLASRSIASRRGGEVANGRVQTRGWSDRVQPDAHFCTLRGSMIVFQD